MKSFFLIFTCLLLTSFLNAGGFSDFIENKGQIGDGNGVSKPEVLFKTAHNNAALFFQKDKVVFLFNKFETVSTEESRSARAIGDFNRAKMLETKPLEFRIDLEFINSNPDVEIIPQGKKTHFSNYYLANCPEGILNVKHYSKITYKNIYPQIDLEYYFNENGLKYDFIINDGGNINDIQLKYNGAENVEITHTGGLSITYADGQTLSELAPVSFFSGNQTEEVMVSFIIEPDGSIRFFTAEEIQSTLIIDPAISWATYFYNTLSTETTTNGYTSPQYDSNGNLFLASQSYDNAFPTINPGGSSWFDNSSSTMIKITVSKFDANKTLIWSTYYGGNNYDCLAGCTDYGKALALDNSGNVYIAGYTNSPTTIFPTYDPGGGAFYQDQSKCYGETSFFLKFDNNGVRLWASMFQHENANTNWAGLRINSICTDGTNLYFSGQTYRSNSNDIPLRNPGGSAYYQGTFVGDMDAFVGRFNSSSGLYWSSYLNSNNIANKAYASGLDVVCDASGNFYMTGRETGNSGPVVHHLIVDPGLGAYMQATPGGSQNIQISKFNTSLQAVWSTYYGGNDMDIPSTIEPDGFGNIYIVGRCTESTTFPTFDPGAGAYCQTVKPNGAGFQDAFILKFTDLGVRQWASYLGGVATGTNHFSGLAFDGLGNVYVSGYTNSATMVTQAQTGSYNQSTPGGSYDMFYYEFNQSAVRQWATYFGSANNETAYNGRMGWQEAACGLEMFSWMGTANTSLSTVDPGGGAWYQSSGGAVNNDFFVLFGNSSTPQDVDIDISASSTTICAGESVTFTATPTYGGTSPTYQWYLNGNPVGTGGTTYTSTGLANGDDVYCVLTSSEGCVTNNPATSGTITISLDLNSTAASSISASETTICAGENVVLTVSGGTLGTGAVWEWYSGSCGGSPVGTGSSVTLTPSASLSYFVSAEGDCNTTTCVSVDITVNTFSTDPSSITASVNPICEGSSSTLTVNGGTLGTGADWVWYVGACGTGTSIGTGLSVSGTPPSTQTFYVGAEGDCNNSACVSLELVVNEPPFAGYEGAATICADAAPIELFDYLNGTPDLGGSWENSSGDPVSETFDPATDSPGTFYYVVAGTPPCPDDVAQVSVYFISLPTIDSLNISDNTSCSPPYDGAITVYVNGSEGDYSYAINGGTAQSDSTFTGLSAGNYTINIESPDGCTLDTVLAIGNSTGLVIDSLDVVNPSCFGYNNGEIIVYSSNGFLYSIDDGINFQTNNYFSNLSADTLDIVVQDASGCEYFSQILLTQPEALTYDSVVVNSNCGPNGSATLTISGGIPPYYYIWDTGSITNSIIDVYAGNYLVTISDANGCELIGSVIVGEDGDVLENVSTSGNLSCFGYSNGFVTIVMTSGTSPYIYNWSNGGSSSSISDLVAGTYIVTVTDNNGCMLIESFNITEPDSLIVDYSVTNVSCFGDSNGSILLDIIGGTPDYSFNWSPFGFAQDSNLYYQLNQGSYAVTVTDANGCSVIIPKIDVNQPNAISLNYTANNILCFGDETGSITTQIIGGAPPYTYLWSTGSSTSSVSNVEAGNYSLSITDNNGCEADINITLTEPEELIVTYTIGTNIIDLVVGGGHEPYTYVWSSGATTQDVTGITGGIYSVTVSDDNDCVVVTVIDFLVDLRIPDAFSPNNDGSNDFWQIEGIDQYPEARVEIYNRWGQLIFESNGYNEMWDGTYNGKDMPHGSYVYILTLEEGLDPINGIVTIIR